MRVIVCGGRNYDDRERVNKCLAALKVKHGIELIIEGGACGADLMASEWAEENMIPVCEFPANWALLGKKAGPIRNKNMLYFMKPDCVVAFPGGAGTDDMVRQAKKAGVKVWEVGQ